MTYTIENISASLDEELTRAIDRLGAARRDLKRDIEALEAERARRAARRKERR
jgi:hypothetical protein